ERARITGTRRRHIERHAHLDGPTGRHANRRPVEAHAVRAAPGTARRHIEDRVARAAVTQRDVLRLAERRLQLGEAEVERGAELAGARARHDLRRGGASGPYEAR